MSLHLKDQILLGQILVTFACSRCLYLDAQSENLSGLADLQKSSLDFVPGLAANAAEALDAKQREQEVRPAEWDSPCSISARYPLQTQSPSFTFPPCTLRPVNSTGNYSWFLELKEVLYIEWLTVVATCVLGWSALQCSWTFLYFSLYSFLKKDIPATRNYLLEVNNISPKKGKCRIIYWTPAQVTGRETPLKIRDSVTQSHRHKDDGKRDPSSFTSRQTISGTGCISFNRHFPKLSLHNDGHRDETTEWREKSLNPSAMFTSDSRNWSTSASLQIQKAPTARKKNLTC